MNRLLLTDTHFGIKQNSTTWLQSQLKFINEQIIPYIKNHRVDKIIHLGDVFDSRSSISPMIATIVRNKFIEMAGLVDEFIIIAGNHDFYSPSSDKYDTLSMVFRDCGIDLVVGNVLIEDNDIFVPWYCYKDDLTPLLKIHPEIDNIYTHADIFGEDREITSQYTSKYSCNVFSGHIHSPNIDKGSGLYNLGSCYSLNFADANCSRSAYSWDDNKLEPIENQCSIKFWRINDNNFFEPLHDPGDYYEFYIEQSNILSPKYQERAAEIAKTHRNYNIIPVSENKIFEDIEFESYDIDKLCESSIPNYLKDKFNKVIARV